MMVQTISKKITRKLLTKGVIEEQLINVYQYGTELMLSCIFTSGLILVLSCIIDSFLAGVLYLAIYMSLKGTAGGYHASSYGRCFFISISAYVVQTIISKVLSAYAPPYLFWLGVLFLSGTYIFCNAPVKNCNHPIGAKALRKNQLRARTLVIFLCVLITLLYFLLQQSYLLNHIVLTIASIAIFMYIAFRKEELQK